MTDSETIAGKRGYAVCTVGRSGSTWFTSLLASTGVLGRPEEAFNPRFLRGKFGPDYPRDRGEQIRYVLTASTTPNGIYGFKVFPIHLSPLLQTVRWTEALPDMRFIHWRRRDILGQALSRHRANQTDQWYSTSRARGTAHYSGGEILREIRWATLQDARWEVFFARTGLSPLRLVYEDAVDDVQGTLDAVASHVGIEERPVADPSLIKVKVQRDETTEDWRARFLEDYGNPNVIGDL